jgi:hypothetical protein
MKAMALLHTWTSGEAEQHKGKTSGVGPDQSVLDGTSDYSCVGDQQREATVTWV